MISEKKSPCRVPIVLAGGGGHATSLVESSDDPSLIAGYLAPFESSGMPVSWLGDDSAIDLLAEKGMSFHIAFVYHGLPMMGRRKELIATYTSKGVFFSNIIAPSAIISRNSTIGKGCAILNRAVINRAHLGNHVIVNTGAIIEHDCEIGDNTFIGPGAVIGGGVKIGRDCFIGLGANIINGATIDDGITVGIGVVVNRSLSEPGIYHGNPMRLHKIKNLKI